MRNTIETGQTLTSDAIDRFVKDSWAIHRAQTILALEGKDSTLNIATQMVADQKSGASPDQP